MRKLNILFIMPQLNMGGAERVILNIINNIDRKDFDIHLILFDKNGTLVKYLASDIKISILNFNSVATGLIPLLFKIYKLKPDIVFSGIGNLNISLAPFIKLFKRLLPNTVWIARQASILSLNNKYEKNPKLYDYLYKNYYKNYDKVICQSEYMQTDLIDNYQFPIEKSVIINNPIDIKHIEKLSHEKMEYSFDPERFNLLSVGHLRPEKGHIDLLRAISLLDESYNLTIIGEGVEELSLKKIAIKLGIRNRIRFIGYQENPYPYMKKADILVLSSDYEGFPNVVLEAGICGLPVVSYQCLGGVSEIIENGVNGFLVEDKNIIALVNGITKARRYRFNPTRIKYKIAMEYSNHTIISKYEKVFKYEE